MMRQCLFDAWHVEALAALSNSADDRISGIAAKALKELGEHPTEGRTVRLKYGPYGPYVELDAGIEGTLPVGEFQKEPVDLTTVLKPGASLELAVVSVDPDQRVITVSKTRATWSASMTDAWKRDPSKGRENGARRRKPTCLRGTSWRRVKKIGPKTS